MADGRTTVSSGHIFDVLRLVAAVGRPIGAAEVATALGLSPTTAHRALLTLLSIKAIGRAFGGGKYVPGVLTRELLGALYKRFPIQAASYPTLRRIAAASGETASLNILLGWYGVRIAAVSGWKPNRLTRIGKHTPLNASAAGRCMLAFQSEAEREDYLERGPKIALTQLTPTSVKDLRGKIEEIRRSGYSIDIGGVFDDVAAVAFPIRLGSDGCIGTVTVEGPSFQFTADNAVGLQEWAGAVAELEALVQSNPAHYISPFAHIPASEVRLP